MNQKLFIIAVTTCLFTQSNLIITSAGKENIEIQSALGKRNFEDNAKESNSSDLLSAIKKNEYEKSQQLIKDGIYLNDYVSSEIEYTMNSAIFKNDIEKAMILLQARMNVKKCFSRQGLTHLLNATIQNRTEIAMMLIQNGDQVNWLQAATGIFPLSAATKNQNFKLIKSLLTHGAHINQKGKLGHIALFDAVKTENMNLLNLFIANGADLTYCNRNTRESALSLAQTIGNRDIIELINRRIEAQNIRDAEEKQEKYDGAQALIQMLHQPVRVIPSPAIIDLTQEEEEGAAQALIQMLHQPVRVIPAPIAIIDLTQEEEIPAIDLNLKNGLGNTPLIQAILDGDMIEINQLIENPNVDKNAKNNRGYTPLNQVIILNNVPAAVALIESDADLNSISKRGYTLLNHTINLGRTDMFKLLINAGANPNLPDDEGVFPLTLAVHKGNAKMLRIIVQAHGFDINIEGDQGRRLLNIAAQNTSHNQLKALNILTEAGANINAKDATGNTLLSYSLIDNNNHYFRTKVKSLIKAGADLNIPNSYGDTPLAFMYKNPHIYESDQIIELLQIHGAHL